jgi:hypothetical protein
MTYTRIDAAQLLAASAVARAAVAQIKGALGPLLVTSLTAEDRARTPRAPVRGAEAARALALASADFPALAQAAGFEADAVNEDIDNVRALKGLAEAMQELAQWVEDSELVWSAEYYTQALALHTLAKKRLQRDGSVRPLVEPFDEVFGARKKPTKKA